MQPHHVGSSDQRRICPSTKPSFSQGFYTISVIDGVWVPCHCLPFGLLSWGHLTQLLKPSELNLHHWIIIMFVTVKLHWNNLYCTKGYIKIDSSIERHFSPLFLGTTTVKCGQVWKRFERLDGDWMGRVQRRDKVQNPSTLCKWRATFGSDSQ